MKFVGHAGDYEIPDRGALLARTGRMARRLLWPAIGAFALAVLATAARLAGPLIVRSGIDNGMLKVDLAMPEETRECRKIPISTT